jgi:glycosyltransferase involved in cell wall biosynthesis
VSFREGPSFGPLRTRIKAFPLSAHLFARAHRQKRLIGLSERTSQLGWSQGPDCPASLYYAAGGAQIGDRLYVIRGYQQFDAVNNKIFVFNLKQRQWADTIEPPDRLANSRAAVCSDGRRFLYAVSGQLGHRSIADGFAFDTVQGAWRSLPALPAARHAGTMQLLGNRLHFVGGAFPDRCTAAPDHWSLAIQDGGAIEDYWREEPPVPRAATHCGSAAIGGTLLVFGGQREDPKLVSGDPKYACAERAKPVIFSDVYRYSTHERRWTQLPDMMVPTSHTDFSVIVAKEKVHVIGGQICKGFQRSKAGSTDLIQTYDLLANRWSISGYLPYRLRSPVCAIHDDNIFCCLGQRDEVDDVSRQGTASTWQIKVAALGRPVPEVSKRNSMPTLNGKEVVVITHELTLTGAPLSSIEIAQALIESGAIVRLFTLADDADYGHPAERYRLAIPPTSTAFAWAARADLVLVNSVMAGPWIRNYLSANPSKGSRLVWWLRENSPEAFGDLLAGTGAVATMLYVSQDARILWERSGLRLPPRRLTVHNGLTDEFCQMAQSDALPWPGGPKDQLLGRAAARQRLGLHVNDFVFLCVGDVISRKGQLLFLRTVGKLLEQEPDLPVHVLLAGFPRDLDRWMTLLSLSPAERKAVLNGRLLWVRQPDVNIFYRAADAFVMNAQGSGEPFGRVTIEAMAFGLPVLGTNAGGTPEIVLEGETGLLHPVGEPGLEVLAANILRLTNDRDYARQLGLAGQKRANEYFSSRRFCRDLEQALAPALNQSKCI